MSPPSTSGWIAGFASTSVILWGAVRCLKCRNRASTNAGWALFSTAVRPQPMATRSTPSAMLPRSDTAKEAVSTGEQLGRITSSAVGYSVGKTLALGFIRTTHAWQGSKVTVIIGGRPVVATVTATPFFDPTGARMRAKASDGPDRVKK